MVDKGSSKLQKFCITIFLKGFSLEGVNGSNGSERHKLHEYHVTYGLRHHVADIKCYCIRLSSIILIVSILCQPNKCFF